MAATLVLRTVKGAPLTNLEVDNNFSNLNTFGSLIDSNVGVLSNLTTTQKSNVVAAINEITTNATITGGNITGLSNLASSGNVYGNYFLGNGSLLSGISVDSTRIISGTSVFSILSANGVFSANVDGSQVLTINKDGAATANVRVLGNITATVTKTSNLQDSSGRTLQILDESNTVIWGG